MPPHTYTATLPHPIRLDQVALYGVAATLIVLIGYPLFGAFRGLTLLEFRALASEALLQATWNSLLATLLTLPPAILLGVPLAWLCVRTNLPYRKLVSSLIATSFVIPMLFTSISYTFLFGKNAGLFNQWWAALFGRPLYDIYSFSGVVFIAVLQCYPLIFFTTAAGLSRFNYEYEEAAKISGLTPAQVTRKVTFGIVMPSILAGAAFAFATAITMLSGPLILAVPVGIPFLTSEMYGAIVTDPNIPRAMALSIPLLIATIAALMVQTRIVKGESERFATVSGKGLRGEIVDLGKWKGVAVFVCLVPLALSLFIPFFTLFGASITEFWWKGLTLENLTLKNYAKLWESDTTRLAMWNSVVLSAGTGMAVTAMGLATAIVLAGRASLLKRAIRQLGMIPLGIAHVVAGVLAILAWYGPPLSLGGTIWILGLGYFFVMFPYVLKTCETARAQVDKSLLEAAEISGLSPLQTWRHVLLPLLKHGAFATFVLVFLFSVKEFPLTAMVYSADTITLAARIFGYFEGGGYEVCGAASIVLLVFTFVTIYVFGRLFGVSVNEIRP